MIKAATIIEGINPIRLKTCKHDKLLSSYIYLVPAPVYVIYISKI